MSQPASLLTAFFSGVAAGAMLLTSLLVWRSRLGSHVRWAALLFGISLTAWLITQPAELFHAFGSLRLLVALNMATAGLFWLFVLAVFSDLPVTPVTLGPSVLLVIAGFVQGATAPPVSDGVWWGCNLFAAILALHAGIQIVRGWRDDLLEGRRRFRGAVMIASCAYAVVNIGGGFLYRLAHDPRWLILTVGNTWGGLIIAVLTLCFGLVCLQPQAAVFGASRRAEPVADARAEAADRLSLQRLQSAMAAGAWRREGLTIGLLAAELEVPEHRLRRLINQRLGYRNFADFVNGWRIEAAKRRLADPAEARSTVAAIAFDLGFGSLGPFNRAFRTVTGATPTAWRREALAAASPELKQAV